MKINPSIQVCLSIIQFKSLIMQSKKANIKDVTIDSFMQGTPMYDMTPPPPIPYPKMIHYSLDTNRHCQHRFLPSFLMNTKPLLISCDMGMKVDEMVIFSEQYNKQDTILDEQDQALINQTLMSINPVKKETKKQQE